METNMPVKLVQSAASAYPYPLLIKQLLLTPLAIAPDQEITYQESCAITTAR
jgi:fatty-acyl-CoA synthase